MNKKVLLSILTLIISIGVKADLDKAIAYAEAGEKTKPMKNFYLLLNRQIKDIQKHSMSLG